MSQPTRNCPTCHTPLPGMAAFCYVCGTATPTGLDRVTGERVAMGGNSGITADELFLRLQRALGPGYQIEERIGAGGFAVVFRVRDLRLKRDLAVKVLRPDLGLSADILQRFRREAETIAALRHAHIVPVYDVGEAEGLAFLIMPLIAGESLRSAMDREGAMSVSDVCRILREAASGLAAAHDTGVIHRDIKPENIMLEGKNRHALLMDFGIAKAVSSDDADPAQALTTTGIIIGTPQYMSPEQATGDKNIDARTDQYSLAVVAYRMLSGKLPFEGESTRAVLYQQLVADPQPLETRVADIPVSLAATIQRAMAKEPGERFPTMRDFAAALDQVHTTTLSIPAIVRPTRRRTPMLIGAAAAVVLTGGFFALRSMGSTPPPALPANPDSVSAPVAAPDSGTTPASGAPAPGTPPATPATTSPAGTRQVAASRSAVTPTGRAGTPPGAAGTTPSPAPEAAPPKPAAGPSCVKLVGAGDWTAAVPLCTREAENGNATSQRILAGLYDKGTGVPEDPARAAEWYRKAAATDPEANFRYGAMLEAGRGVKKNTDEGIAHLREAAASGYQQAQQLLAYRLEIGSNLKKNEAEAALWYRRLAEKGERESQAKLAEFLAKGRGVTKNETEALEWYKKAGEKGLGAASWQASQMYFKGQGTPKNEAEGMTWLRKAAEAGHADATKELAKRGG